MGRTAGLPRVWRPKGRKVYVLSFTHEGRAIRRSTKSRDRDVAQRNALAIYERVTASTRYFKPRGLPLLRERVFGHAALPLPPRIAGVYLAWCPLLPKFFKIGWSTDMRRRMRHLQTGLPAPLHLLAYLPGDRALELDLHRRFKAARVRGEWFRASQRIADAFVYAEI